MKQKKIVRIIAIIIAAALALSLLMIPFAGIAFAAEAEEDGVTVLFTHDLHDHILPVNRTGADGTTVSSGGCARLKTAMDVLRARHAVTLTVDAGDFSMGSLFQSVYETDAPELRMLGVLGVDAATFGNHEYDYGPAGLAAMLTAAKDSGDPLPAIVQANYRTPREDVPDAAALTDAMADYGVTDYAVFERGGVRIAVFGIMGTDADACAPNSAMALADPVKTARAVVETIQAQEQPDMIVCLSHSGTSENEKLSEDAQLAKAVPEIDLIVSGHTHTTLASPLQVGNTLIVSCGSYCENLGAVTLLPAGGGRWALGGYELIPIDGSIPGDPATEAVIDTFKAAVQEKYLDHYGLSFDQVLAHNNVPFLPEDQMAQTREETGLGNLLADSYLYTIRQAEGADYEPVALAAVPLGVVRASLPLGDLTTANAFDVLPLGKGPDGRIGYPLVSVYLTGRELKDAAEIDASVGEMLSYARLYTAGISYTCNPERMILDRVTEVKLINEDGSEAWPVPDRLYRVVTDLYSAQMFASVQKQTYGLLKIVPKDKDGNEITDFSQAIVRDADGSEIKAWQCAAAYLASFPAGADGVSAVPEAYAAPAGRKIIAPDASLGALFSNPGTTTSIGIALFVGILAAGFALAMLIVRRMRRRQDSEPEHL